LTLSGAAEFQGGQLTVGGAVTVNSLLIILGTAVFNGNVTIADASLSLAGSASIGTVSFNGDAPLVLTNYSQTGGTLTGSANVHISGQLSWSAGTMSGTGKTVIDVGATATLLGTVSGVNFHDIGRAFENAGTTNLTGLNVSIYGSVTNLPGATFNAI